MQAWHADDWFREGIGAQVSKLEHGSVTASLTVIEHVNAMPMVGWHEPRADIKHDGKRWQLAIGGGCQTIWLTSPNGRDYSVKITDLLPALMDKINLIEASK